MNSINRALEWARSIQLFAPISEHHRRAVSQLWPIIEPLGIRTALEVGIGEPPGLVVEMLEEHGIDAGGLDVQPGGDVQADMHDLPFEDDSIDLVVSRHSLEHVLIPYVCLFEMKRVSRNWLLVIVPVESEKSLDWPDHLHGYSKGGWELMFKRAGLTIQHYELGDHTEEHARQSGAWKDEEYRFLLSKE